MSCEACTKARQSYSGLYLANCEDCKARALAQSPSFFDAAKADALTPAYRNALKATFGEDWRAGHEKVKEWSRG